MKRTPLLSHFLSGYVCLIFSVHLLHAQIKATLPDVEFANVNGKSLMLDFYFPQNITAPLPVIVWIHGGAWTSGDKSSAASAASLMIPRGYAVVGINYRLSQDSVFPVQIYDCKAAIRWLRANASRYDLDPNRIGVWGSSAGGHLVALLGTSGDVKELEGAEGNPTYSSRVQAVCDWYGPSNLNTIGNYPSNIDRSLPNCPEALLIGGLLKENPDKARRASPIAYVTADDPPFLIQHGTVDMTVPFHQSVELDSALKLANVNCTFIPIIGAGHGGGGFNADSTRTRVANFFDQYVKNTVTSIHSNNSRMPIGYALEQNYPNPFHPLTIIRFAILKHEHVALRVFDLYGRPVATLVNTIVDAGDHLAYLNMRNSAFGILPSGVYLYRIQTPSFTQTRAMIFKR